MDIYCWDTHEAGRQGTAAQRYLTNDSPQADWRWGLRTDKSDKDTFFPTEERHRDTDDLSTSNSSPPCRLLNSFLSVQATHLFIVTDPEQPQMKPEAHDNPLNSSRPWPGCSQPTFKCCPGLSQPGSIQPAPSSVGSSSLGVVTSTLERKRRGKVIGRWDQEHSKLSEPFTVVKDL